MTSENALVRDYTVRNTEGEVTKYVGFDCNYDPVYLNHVVIVLVDGEPELYAVENPKAVSGLIAYLNEHSCGTIHIVGAFTRK